MSCSGYRNHGARVLSDSGAKAHTTVGNNFIIPHTEYFVV